MEIFVWVIHVITAIVLVGLVLMQHGKGADMGAAFGSGSAGSLFGSSGSANFLSRTTGVLAAVFFVTSLGLTYVSSHKGRSEGVMSTHDELPVDPAKSVPVPSAPASQPGDSKANDIPK